MLPRRAVLGAAAAGACAPLLAGCQTSPTDPPETTDPLATPQDCIDLADHTFSHRRFCTPDPPDTPGVDYDIVFLDYDGPLVVTPDGLIASFMDAVTQWDAQGTPMRLLAPRRSDSTLFAHAGRVTVNPRCDGSLVCHADGCATTVLSGHRVDVDKYPTDGIQGMCWVDDQHLISLGTDGTLRRWHPASGAELAQRSLDLDHEQRWLYLAQDASHLVVSTPDRATSFDPQTLEPIEDFAGLPPSALGWRPGPNGKLLGSQDRTDNRGLLVRANDGDIGLFRAYDRPKAIAVSDSGLIAAVFGHNYFLLDQWSQVREVRLEHPASQACAASFNADATLLHILDGLQGPQTVNAQTGARLVAYQPPNRR